MSQQVEDPFNWKGETWVFLSAENVYSIFEPNKFGLNPEWIDTACYKGFVIEFSVVDDRLFLQRLIINTEDDKYPPINDVLAQYARKDKRDGWIDGYHVYDKINLFLEYTGTIIIGKDFKEDRYGGSSFTGPYSYYTTFDLKFENGILIDYEETSGKYKGTVQQCVRT